MHPESVHAFIRYPDHVPLAYRPCPEGERPTLASASTRGNGAAGPSPGGICFHTGEHLDAGRLVHVSLSAPRGVEGFTVRVAWCRPEGGRFLTGARLLDEHDACRARMVAQLCLIDAYRRTEQAGGRDLDNDTAAREWISRYAHRVPAIT